MRIVISTGEDGLLRERRAHATAWLAPLPPEPVEKEDERRVSPAVGRRGVRVMRSMLREPMIVMEGGAMSVYPDFLHIMPKLA